MKKERGITIVALVVTIIVLLILAGVTIVILTGENGILTKMIEVNLRNDIGTLKEELEITKGEKSINGLGNREVINASEYKDLKNLMPSFKKEYQGKLEVRNDKLVYVGTDKDEYVMAVKMDLLPEDELLNDELLEELQPFITEWTVEDGESIILPLHNHIYSNKYNFTVDYGDGTGIKEITDATDEDKTHIYDKAGTYTVTIKGQCPVFEFSQDSTSKDKITKIVQWGNVFKGAIWNGVDFLNCINLKGEIPEPSKNTFANINFNWRGIFGGCTNLTGPIPEKLFLNCTADTIKSAFYGCTNLTGSIPDDLFKNCIDVTSFESMFYNCKNLTGGIPENLFANCTKVKTFGGTFNGCTGLTGSIPENLFNNCNAVKSFDGTFNGCTGLTGSIPENLFKNCPNVEYFGYGWWTGCFSGCSGLTGSIPENLFANNTKVTNFHAVFMGCTGLTGSIPGNLFSNCTEVENFWWTFRNCTGLTGSIPENLFANNTKVKNFAATFVGCRGLTGSIPENLFANCTEVERFGYVYQERGFWRMYRANRNYTRWII